RTITQISICGKRNSPLPVEPTKGRIWRQLKNDRGYTLKCSHYLPSPFPEDTSLPCVIYCHGNSGCRADANEAAVILLPSNITVFTLDFSGSGLSDGDYVSLGWHEKDDLKIVVSHLRSNKQISRIGLWGRSMGAVTRKNLNG
ncbi:esterase/lipase domain protein, partial [Trifolium medium]|nr:esterase/lipase domain protein [Trifolium medium]